MRIHSKPAAVMAHRARNGLAETASCPLGKIFAFLPLWTSSDNSPNGQSHEQKTGPSIAAKSRVEAAPTIMAVFAERVAAATWSMASGSARGKPPALKATMLPATT